MALKTISRQKIEESARKFGIKIAPPDHPIYSEGPSITFLGHIPGLYSQKDTDSQRGNSQTSSDTQTKKQD